jgi:hypothetical protein
MNYIVIVKIRIYKRLLIVFQVQPVVFNVFEYMHRVVSQKKICKFSCEGFFINIDCVKLPKHELIINVTTVLANCS